MCPTRPSGAELAPAQGWALRCTLGPAVCTSLRWQQNDGVLCTPASEPFSSDGTTAVGRHADSVEMIGNDAGPPQSGGGHSTDQLPPRSCVFQRAYIDTTVDLPRARWSSVDDLDRSEDLQVDGVVNPRHEAVPVRAHPRWSERRHLPQRKRCLGGRSSNTVRQEIRRGHGQPRGCCRRRSERTLVRVGPRLPRFPGPGRTASRSSTQPCAHDQPAEAVATGVHREPS